MAHVRLPSLPHHPRLLTAQMGRRLCSATQKLQMRVVLSSTNQRFAAQKARDARVSHMAPCRIATMQHNIQYAVTSRVASLGGPARLGRHARHALIHPLVPPKLDNACDLSNLHASDNCFVSLFSQNHNTIEYRRGGYRMPAHRTRERPPLPQYLLY